MSKTKKTTTKPKLPSMDALTKRILREALKREVQVVAQYEANRIAKRIVAERRAEIAARVDKLARASYKKALFDATKRIGVEISVEGY